MQASTSCDDLLQSAADPKNQLHNVYLLMELRRQKKDLYDQQVQKDKSELIKRLTDYQPSLTGDTAYARSRKRHSLTIGGGGDTRKDKRSSFPPGDGKSRLTKKSSTVFRTSKNSPSWDLAVISNFYSVIELISSFYSISDDEEFSRNRDQLMETLSLLKNYKSFDDVLNQYIKKYKDLCDFKKRFCDAVGEQVPVLYSGEI